MPPMSPRARSGPGAGGIGIRRMRTSATGIITEKSPSSMKNQARNVNGSAVARMP